MVPDQEKASNNTPLRVGGYRWPLSVPLLTGILRRTGFYKKILLDPERRPAATIMASKPRAPSWARRVTSRVRLRDLGPDQRLVGWLSGQRRCFWRGFALATAIHQAPTTNPAGNKNKKIKK